MRLPKGTFAVVDEVGGGVQLFYGTLRGVIIARNSSIVADTIRKV